MKNFLFPDNYNTDTVTIEEISELENIDIMYKFLENKSDFDNSFQNILQEKYESINNNKIFNQLNNKILEVLKGFQRASNIEVSKLIRSFNRKISQDKKDIYPYLSKLKEYKGSNIEIDDIRHTYSHIFEDQLPSSKALNDFIDIKIDIDKAINKDKTITNYERLEYLKNEYLKLTEYIKSGKCYSETRAKCLGLNGEISVENFLEELSKTFSDPNKDISGPLTIEEVRETAKRFEKYEKIINEINTEKNDIWKQYNYIINNLKSIDISYSVDWFGTSREEFDKFYKLYIELKLNQIVHMNEIYLTVFYYRIQTIVRSYLQDRNTLIKACAEIDATETVSNESFIEDYNLFLVEEQFNAVETYLSMMEANGINELVINESTIISLNEAKFDNLKNFLINICKRLSEAFDKFINRINELFKADEKFLNNNMKIITSDQIIKNEATISDYYSYNGLIKKLATITFKPTTSAEIVAKAEAGQWQTPEDYLKNGGATGINGFTYDANKGSIKDQIEDYLRANKSNISSNALNAEIRANLAGYCKNDFPQIKKLIDADKAALKTFGKAMDSFIATSTSNSNQQTTSTVQQSISITPANQPAEQNASFSYEDTMLHYFNEVDINNNNPNAIPGNQAKINKENEKSEADAKKDRDKAISNATKSYIKVNTQKMSAKMNIAVEAYRQCMKILKWYVKEYNKQNKEEKETNNEKNKNTGSISDAI